MDVEVKKFSSAGLLKTALLLLAVLLGLLVFGAGTARAEEGAVVYGLYDTDHQVYACDAEGQKTGFDPIDNKKVTNLFVAEGVTEIANEAFRDCGALKEVTMPDTVTEIGESAFSASGLTSINLSEKLTLMDAGVFSQCKALKEITLPDTVTEIGISAFSGSGLTSISLPKNLKKIEYDTFRNCKHLEKVMMQDKVTEIESNAFWESGLTSITLSESLTKIGETAFYHCTNLKEVTLPDKVTEIGVFAFDGSGLTSITLPKSLTKIDIGAFAGCIALKEVTLPDKVTEIEYDTFYGSGLTSITLPENLKTIGSDAFVYCDNLTRMVLSGATPPTVVDGAFDNTPSPRYMVLTGAAATSGKYGDEWEGFTKTKALGTDEVSLPSIPDQTYTGSAFEPDISKAIAGTKDTDYQVTYENNTNAGQATVHITADDCLGMYTGSADISFNINPAAGSAQVSQAGWTYGQAGDSPVPVSETNGTDQVTYAYKAKDAGDDTYQAEKPTAAGQYTVQASFAAVQNYEAVTATADFTIEKAQPVMTIAPEAGKEIQVGEPITLNIALKGVKDETPEGTVAILGKNLTLKDGQASIAYTPADTKPITLTAAYTPADGENYTSAQANTTLEAGKKTRETIVVNAAAKTYGDPDFTLTPTGGSLQPGEAYTYTSDNEAVAGVKADGTVTITGAGTAHITVSIVESSVWNPAEAVMPLVVAKATPAYDIPNLTAVYGQTLKDVALPEGFSWQDDESTAVGNAGSNTFKATYTPADPTNYQTVADIEVRVTVSKGESTLVVQADKTQFTYGDAFTLTVDVTLKPQSRSLTRAAADTVDIYLGDPADSRQMATAAVENGKATATIEKSNPNYPNGGSADITVVYNGSGSLNKSIGSLHLDITPAPGSAKVSQEGWTYGQAGASPVPVSETNGTENVTYDYKTKDAGDDTYQAEKPTNAGDYTLRATFAATQNYKAVTATADFAIEKAQPVLTIAPEAGKEIQVGEPVTLNIDVKGVKDEQPKGTVEILGQTLPLQAGQATVVYNPADDTPKTLTAIYTPAEGENYTGTQASLTLTAGKKSEKPEPTPTPGTGSDTTSNPALENTTNNTTENTTERTTDNTNTGLAGSGTTAGAAVLLSLLALTGLFVWQKSKKQ